MKRPFVPMLIAGLYRPTRRNGTPVGQRPARAVRCTFGGDDRCMTGGSLLRGGKRHVYVHVLTRAQHAELYRLPGLVALQHREQFVDLSNWLARRLLDDVAEDQRAVG